MCVGRRRYPTNDVIRVGEAEGVLSEGGYCIVDREERLFGVYTGSQTCAGNRKAYNSPHCKSFYRFAEHLDIAADLGYTSTTLNLVFWRPVRHFPGSGPLAIFICGKQPDNGLHTAASSAVGALQIAIVEAPFLGPSPSRHERFPRLAGTLRKLVNWRNIQISSAVRILCPAALPASLTHFLSCLSRIEHHRATLHHHSTKGLSRPA